MFLSFFLLIIFFLTCLYQDIGVNIFSVHSNALFSCLLLLFKRQRAHGIYFIFYVYDSIMFPDY